MAVDIFGNHVEIASNDRGDVASEPRLHLLMETIHPGEFVVEAVAAHRVAVGEVDVRNTDSADESFEETRVLVGFVTGELVRDDFDGLPGQDRDAVVALLCDGSGLIAELAKGFAEELKAAGATRVFPISGATGAGIDKLLDAVLDFLPERAQSAAAADAPEEPGEWSPLD